MRPQFQLPSHSNYPSLIAACQPHPMATGSGKTFTAVSSCYRLNKYSRTKGKER